MINRFLWHVKRDESALIRRLSAVHMSRLDFRIMTRHKTLHGEFCLGVVKKKAFSIIIDN